MLGAITMGPTIESLLGSHGVADIAAALGPIGGHPVNCAAPATQVQDLRWFEAAQTLNSSGPNQKGKQKSAYMRAGFTTAMTATMYRYLTASRLTPRRAPVDLSASLPPPHHRQPVGDDIVDRSFGNRKRRLQTGKVPKKARALLACLAAPCGSRLVARIASQCAARCAAIDHNNETPLLPQNH